MDRGEAASADVVGAQGVLNLLQGEPGDAERGALPDQARVENGLRKAPIPGGGTPDAVSSSSTD
ncbi:hypothetical protein GCM10017687_30010 [Streptomyces echinatus]